MPLAPHRIFGLRKVLHFCIEVGRVLDYVHPVVERPSPRYQLVDRVFVSHPICAILPARWLADR